MCVLTVRGFLLCSVIASGGEWNGYQTVSILASHILNAPHSVKFKATAVRDDQID
jgi:hypothetical protein